MSRWSQRVFACLLAVVGLLVAADALTAQQKAAVPDDAAEQASRKAVGELYGERFRQAKTVVEKTSLATEMIDAALKVKDGSADQYVLLRIARDVAAGAGDAPTALRAAEKTVERFDVPGAKLTAETLQAAARKATTPSQQKAVAEAVLSVVDAVADEDEDDLALSLCESARASAQRARQYALGKELTAKIEVLKRRQRTSQDYRDALAVLEKNPTDPAANLAVGRHLCFVKGDWDRGVPMLAVGSDAELKAAAAKDLGGSASAEEQAAAGDAWWALAEKKQGPERDAVRLRAGFWYRQAEPKLVGGLAGLKVKQRLAELEKLGREIPKAPRKPTPPGPASPRAKYLAGAVLVTTFEPDTVTSKDDKLRVADLSGCGNDGIVVGATQTPTGRAGAALQFGGKAYVEFPALRDHLTKELKELSLACWVLQADRNDNAMIFDVGGWAGRSITLYRNNGRFRFMLPGGAKHSCATGQSEARVWYHLVGVWNGTAVAIYANGRLVASEPTQGLTLDAAAVSADPARIGAPATGADRSELYFRGLIDELAIFNRALSEQEVQILCQLGLRGEPLVKAGRGRSAR